MSTRRALIAVLGAAALCAGCSNSAGGIPIGFSTPLGLVAFRGLTTKNPAEPDHPYVAVANSGKDELVFIDALDDKAVPSPILIKALAIPTLPGAPRPTEIVAQPLHDGSKPDATGKPDLLVAVAAGSAELQLVATWDLAAHVVTPASPDPLDLGQLVAGAQILALAAGPVPQLDPVSGAYAPTPGKARIYATLAGGYLAVADFARGADGDSIAPVGTPVVQHVGFEGLSLSVSPDNQHVYVATTDEIGAGSGVFGVAELDASGTPGAFTVRALDARAGTRLVADAFLTERFTHQPVPNGDTFCVQDPAASAPLCAAPNTTHRVYAFLDPASCGRSFRVPCGIAVIDPVAGGLEPDPEGEMPYLAPISVPAIPLAMLIAGPPKNPPTNNPPTTPYTVDPEVRYGSLYGFMKISPRSGQQWATAVAVLPSTDGRIYYVDLGRWHIPVDSSVIRSTTRTRVTGGVAFSPDLTVESPTYPGKFITQPSIRRLGLWNPDKTKYTGGNLYTTSTLISSGTLLPQTVKVTPGYTDSDTWNVTYQGALPGLSARVAQTGTAPGGGLWLAMQTPGSGGAPVDVVRLYDPSLFVHPGDIVQVAPPSSITACLTVDPTDAAAVAARTTSPTTYESRITGILPPAAAYPGGAVLVDLAQLVDVRDPRPALRQQATPACIAALQNPSPLAQVVSTIRAAELMLAGSSMGYVGRPPLVEYDPTASSPPPPFAAGYSIFSPPPVGEDALACPVLPWPADPLSAPASFSSCTDPACRDACEQLVLARKARRIYYLSDPCSTIDGISTSAGFGSCWYDYNHITGSLPDATGPLLSLRVGCAESVLEGGKVKIDQATKLPIEQACVDLNGMASLERDMILTFVTQSGLNYAYRARPTSSSAAASFPTAATLYDRSPVRPLDGYRFYVSFPDGFVLDFSTADGFNTGTVIY